MEMAQTRIAHPAYPLMSYASHLPYGYAPYPPYYPFVYYVLPAPYDDYTGY
jgi:hypothetical protein